MSRRSPVARDGPRDLARRLGFWLALPWLVPQALLVRRRAPRFTAPEGPAAGIAGPPGSAPGLHLLAVGDSIIAGVGARRHDEALPCRLATELAARTGAGVAWAAHGMVGADAAEVRSQVLPRVAPTPADLILVSVGVNDVTGPARRKRWRANLGALLDDLRRHSPQALIVLVGLPPMGVFPLLPQPLRRVLGWRAASFDRVAIHEIGRRRNCLHAPVAVPGRTEAEFSPDGYHPSPAGYRSFAGVLAELAAPHLRAGAG